MSEEQIARFWSKVDIQGPEDCWSWIACKGGKGYAQFKFNGKYHRASRIAYELTYGPIPEGLCCLHHCDNIECINPGHMFLGTHKDTMNDMTLKGRRYITLGIDNGRAKLTEEQVLEIRRLYALENHMLQREIALMFGISRPLVGSIITRKRWKHI